MAHYAKIEDGIVTQVIVAEQDFMDLGRLPGQWLQTSYNTRGGVHYKPNSDESDGGVALRMNYASIGYTYDSTLDAFIPPKPYDSWVLDENICDWEAPIPLPDDDGFPPSKSYYWDESIQNWVEDLVTD
jgi:hypothetical protein